LYLTRNLDAMQQIGCRTVSIIIIVRPGFRVKKNCGFACSALVGLAGRGCPGRALVRLNGFLSKVKA